MGTASTATHFAGIDVSKDDFPSDADRDYGIPAANPFSGAGGAPEVLHYGLRNPFRASFDRVTGELWIGDVGQDTIEEIDRVPAGQAGRERSDFNPGEPGA